MAAARAEAPEDDLGLIDQEAVGRRRLQAGGVANGAIDVAGVPARAADEVVMVVVDPGLVAGRMPGGLDAPQKPGAGESVEGVVDRLCRDAPKPPGDRRAHRVCVGVARHLRDDVEHGHAWSRDPEPMSPQALGNVVWLIRHERQDTRRLESF